MWTTWILWVGIGWAQTEWVEEGPVPPVGTKKDRDGDGVPNKEDACPDEFAATFDGCAFPVPAASDSGSGDADGDGVRTSEDACVSDAEDYDGFEDADGCPDVDNDGDGVPDTMDFCPNEAERLNGYEDDDGCPDEAPTQFLTWPGTPSPAPSPLQQLLPTPVPARPAPVVAAPAPVPAPAGPPVLPSVDGRLPSGVRTTGDAAVVVGLEDYAFVADVPYARRDADAFATFLLYTRGVPADRIRQLSAGSVEGLRKALDETGRSVGPGGTVWVYFAGHGAASIATGERVLLGDDVRPDPSTFDARTLPVAEVERLASAGGGKALLVLDTCYAGAGRGGETLLAGRRFAIPTYAVTSSGSAAQWLAAAPDELSGPLASTQHGAFTYLVLGALRGWADGELDGRRDGKVTAEEANAFVSRSLRTLQVHDQHPKWVGASAADWVLSTGVTETPPAGLE